MLNLVFVITSESQFEAEGDVLFTRGATFKYADMTLEENFNTYHATAFQCMSKKHTQQIRCHTHK